MEKPSELAVENVTTPPSYGERVGLAMFSAALFGGLGAMLGRWLGVRGNEPSRQMAAPIMQWGMGIFSALLAAYSSFKASDQVEKASVPNGPAMVTAEMDAPQVMADKAGHVPLSSIRVEDVKTQGMVGEPVPQRQV